ncbi:MAG: PspC domain-containing protein [Flavobacteriaceae bacterium]|nr:PspC domain-containing protein [Flavobacteriaceae bacterium]
MNKTININLGGFFFHIDETAYQKLKRYLESISKSLSDDPQGKNEIIADIEARISELLSEKITDARQVVNEGDIDDIIKIMGQPEDYAETDDAYSDASYSYTRNSAATKKLFRDGEDKFLGGVAAGIAHYLNVDIIWIRLAFLASFVLGGFGFLLYIVLWILLPEAKTTAEKLQMQGEPVNIDNIERKIREEFNNVSENVKTVANKASEKIKEGAEKVNETFSGKPKKNNGASSFFDTIGKIILTLFKIFGKFIGIIIIFVSAAVILSLIIGGFSVGSLEWLNVDGDILTYPPFFYESVLPVWLLTLFVFLLVGIPFLVLFILGLRILSSNVQKISKPISLTLLGIWLVSLLGLIFTGLEFGSSHTVYGKTTDKKSLNIVANDTLNLKMINNDDLYYRHNLRRTTRKEEVEVNGKRMTYGSYIKVDVVKSNSNKNYFVVQKDSRGRNKLNANKNAEQIQYNFKVENNTVILDAYYLSDFKNIWKDEEIKIIFYVAEGVYVYFDNTVKNYLYNVDNTEDIYDKDMANHYFKMTAVTLDCTDCDTDLDEDIKEEIEE